MSHVSHVRFGKYFLCFSNFSLFSEVHFIANTKLCFIFQRKLSSLNLYKLLISTKAILLSNCAKIDYFWRVTNIVGETLNQWSGLNKEAFTINFQHHLCSWTLIVKTLFQANFSFSYPLKTSENERLSDIFRGKWSSGVK